MVELKLKVLSHAAAAAAAGAAMKAEPTDDSVPLPLCNMHVVGYNKF